MHIICPSCSVKNPPKSKSCRLCRADLKSGPPAPPGILVSTAEASPQQSSQSLTLEAPYLRLQGLVGTIAMSCILLPTMYYTLRFQPSLLMILFFGWILSVLFVPQVLMLIRPKRIVVKDRRLLAKGMPSIASPIENILQMAHDGMGIGILFQSLSAVEGTQRAAKLMRKTHHQTGFHLHFPGFTVEQAELLRQTLRLEKQAPVPNLRLLSDYIDKVYDLTPFVFITYALIAINVAIFGIMLLFGVHWQSPGMHDLIKWGADYGQYTTNGQPWRLFTACFLHIGVFHLFFNMWALFAIGPLMERLLGNIGFLLVYIASGFAGSILSIQWNPMVVSAGASGAIFGIFGAMLGFLVLHYHSMPKPLYRHLWKSGLAFLAFNLVFGSVIPGIDMAGHIGGAIAGFFAGMILSQPIEKTTMRSRLWRNGLLALFATLMIGPAFFLMKPVEGPDADWLRCQMQFDQVEKMMTARINYYREGLEAKNLQRAIVLQMLDQEMIPAQTQLLEQIQRAHPTIPESQALRVKLIPYLKLRIEACRLLADGLELQDVSLMNRGADRMVEATKLRP
jgi:rhomboid protease GluP